MRKRLRTEMPEPRPRIVLLLAVAIAAGACGGTDAEQEIRELIAGAEAAAEARSTGYFRGLVSDDYADSRGRRKDELIDAVRAFFVVNPTVDVTTRIDEIALLGDGVATVTLRATVDGARAGPALLGGNAPYRVDVELFRVGGDWRVIGAEWRAADR